jgi:hypothetical protein
MLFTERGRKVSKFAFQIIAVLTIISMIALAGAGLF